MTNRRRSLPQVSPKTPPELRPLVTAIAEIIEVGEGVRGDPLDRKLTLRDLVSNGILSLDRGGNAQPGDGLAPPPTSVGALSNLTANGAFQNIILSWEGINQPGYSYTEIWRAEEDNLSNAVLVGVTPGAVYPDPVNDTKDYYYWVRAVSTSDHPGPYNDTAGTVAQIAPDYEAVRDVLTATQWQPSTAYGALDSVVPTTDVSVEGTNIRLLAVTAGTTGASEPDWATSVTTLGDTVVDGSVTWEAVEAGKIPFYVDPGTGLVVIDGAAIQNASIDNAKIGSLAADKLFVVSGTVFELLVNNGSFNTIDTLSGIQSTGYSAGSAGFRILGTGSAEFNDVTARGHIEADTGYIAQTVQVGGTSKDFADILALETTIDDWTRPGSTLINGNKIFTGDAYVDTLQIQGQAVTFPRGAQRTSAITVDASSTDVLSLSATLTAGAPIIVTLTVEMSDSTEQGATSPGALEMSLVRGSTVLYGPVIAMKAGYRGQDISSTNQWALEGTASFQVYIASPSSGTYKIRLRSTAGSCVCESAFLTILEAKR